jgi:hypothetical protein
MRQSKKQDAVSIGRRKDYFIMEERIKLLAGHEQLSEHVGDFFPAICEADHDKAAKACEHYTELWNLLVEPVQFQQTKDLSPMDMRKRGHVMYERMYLKSNVNAAISHGAE